MHSKRETILNDIYSCFILSAMFSYSHNYCTATEECLARALYCLEMAWHPSFDVASGSSCRLDYQVEENRPLFVALFRHIQVGKVCVDIRRGGIPRVAISVPFFGAL